MAFNIELAYETCLQNRLSDAVHLNDDCCLGAMRDEDLGTPWRGIDTGARIWAGSMTDSLQ